MSGEPNPTVSEPFRDGIRIDEWQLHKHLDEVVRDSVEPALNALLDAEADRLCNARPYERSPDRLDTRAGSSTRSLHTKAGAVEPHVPRLRKLPFEAQIIERDRLRESSGEASLSKGLLSPFSLLVDEERVCPDQSPLQTDLDCIAESHRRLGELAQEQEPQGAAKPVRKLSAI
jgi:hypothetical protein